MTNLPETPQPSQLWKEMTEDQKLRAAEAFWREDDAIDQQLQAMALLAQKLKARPKFVAGLPPEKKARHLARFPNMPDVLAARLLVSYHLGHQRPMMGAFLDRLGIKHDDGLIADDPEGGMQVEKLDEGVEALKGAYPAEDVRLYLATLVAQDPETWGGLRKYL